MSASLGLTGPSCSGVLPTKRAGQRSQSAHGAVAMAKRPANPYEVLRVRQTASAAEIKAAYRALAKRFHPDFAPAGSGPDFVQIQRAYATLSDQQARARHDRTVRPVWFSPSVRFGTRRWETDQCW